MKNATIRKAVNAVNNFLYRGNGEFSWATQILPVCNVKKDIQELNKFVMDCLRAVMTGKKKVGGLGYVATTLTTPKIVLNGLTPKIEQVKLI